MNHFDDENNIIEHFQSLSTKDIFIPCLSKKVEKIVNSIHNKEEWELWIDSSKKNQLPPDFFCDELTLMMEVMRVDDHARIEADGKIINPTNKRESEIIKEILRDTSLDISGHKFLINPDTKLSADEDHNFEFYISNFKRVVKKHLDKVKLYRENHPNYKLIFFVCDESSAYVERFDERESTGELIPGMIIRALPHLFFLDKEFLDIFKKSGVDFLIWFAPYKHIETPDGIHKFPDAIVYDLKKMWFKKKKYNHENMVSIEQ